MGFILAKQNKKNKDKDKESFIHKNKGIHCCMNNERGEGGIPFTLTFFNNLWQDLKK